MGVHAKRGLSDCAKSLALKLFEDCNNHISTKLLLRAQRRHRWAVDINKLCRFGGLHCASVFGIVDLVVDLVGAEGGCGINPEDCTGNTPLAWAAWSGHEEVVKMLLGRDDINPDKPDRHGQTPLWCAAKSGHEGVVKMLLGRGDVNPDTPDKHSRTPLYCAAWNGHEGVVKMLLERDDVSPDKPNFHGKIPLWCTVQKGHEGVVEMLLGRDDVDPDGGGLASSLEAILVFVMEFGVIRYIH